MTARIFGVDYQFLACGDVFTEGLRHAAEALGFAYAHADWNDRDLPATVARFDPSLLVVVHGRRFARRWPTVDFRRYRSAVWLLDEPYEVDDTRTYSDQFSRVFVNDPATLARHPGAVYLPVCYDPRVHYPDDVPPAHAVGFIGGGNATRDRYLAALAARGLLSYVVGGSWADAGVMARCRTLTITPAETAALYRATRIVLNVWRDRHHFNRDGVAATALNPRVYEALACGALVVSEWRPEVDTLVPDLPTFRTVDECLAVVTNLLEHPDDAEACRVRCAAALASHTYAARLRTILDVMADVPVGVGP